MDNENIPRGSSFSLQNQAYSSYGCLGVGRSDAITLLWWSTSGATAILGR